jgi:hypothetical protein
MPMTYEGVFLLLHDGLDVSYMKAIPHRNINVADLAEELLRCNIHDELAGLQGRGRWTLISNDENQPSRVDCIVCLYMSPRLITD